MIVQGQTTSFKKELYEAVHNFTTDTFKIALYTANASLSQDTLIYTVTGEITGTGYTAGGKNLVSPVVSSAEGVAYISFNNISWPTSSFTTRGALIYNKLIETKKLSRRYETIKDGDKVKFCYMKLPNPTQENVLSVLNVLPKEFALEKYIDYETQFEKAYLEPLKIIVNTFGWSAEPVSSLKGFFT